METARGPLAKVTDFGLATNPECDETAVESVAEVVGTPEYMAPEQLRGQCSSRSDIYALGLTVFQMLTGKLPCSHDAPFVGLEADIVKRIGPRWRDAITKALAANPADRFATVDEFWCALSGEYLPRQSGWKAIAAGISRNRATYAIGACAVLTAIIPVLAGQQPYVLDPWMVQLLRTHLPGFQQPLLERLRRQEFGAVVLTTGAISEKGAQEWFDNNSFGPGFVEALQEHYTLSQVIARDWIYLPKP